jgi:hypothetical protein
MTSIINSQKERACSRQEVFAKHFDTAASGTKTNRYIKLSIGTGRARPYTNEQLDMLYLQPCGTATHNKKARSQEDRA